MKFCPAVRDPEDYIVKNLKIFTSTEQDWIIVQKIKKKTLRRNSKPTFQTKQYVLDAVDYYNNALLKYEQEYEEQIKNRKLSFEDS